jgi:lipid II:glycine glycyltransferase (peptidoglycan interpeptide bridge formation enzyme)
MEHARVLARIGEERDRKRYGDVWKTRFTGSARTNVRKAERSQLTIEKDTTGRLLPVFYGLYELSIDRWAGGNRVQQRLARWQAHRRDPLRKLERIADHLGDDCSVWVAWHQGQPAASVILVRGSSTSYTKGAMNKDLAGPTRANYILHKLAIEDACDRRCSYYHMGDTGNSRPLAQFKTRLGAAAYPYSEFHVETLPITRVERSLRDAARRIVGFGRRSGEPPATR